MGRNIGRATRRFFSVLLVVGAMLIAGLPVIGTPAAEAGGGDMLMVVGGVNGSGLPPSRDRPVLQLLQDLGFTVELLNDDDATVAATVGKELVYVSSSVVPSKIGDLFAGISVPVVTSEGFLHHEFGFTAGPNGDSSSTQKVVTIVDDTHPIAAGYSGVVSVTTGPQNFAFARNLAGGTVIAQIDSSAVVFAFDAGDPLTIGTAPARRVGLFMNYVAAGALTQAGRDIVTAAVEWATTSLNDAPEVDAGADQTVVSAGPVLATLDGTASDDGLPAVPGTLTTTWSGGGGVSFGDPAAVDTTVTLPGPGTYELTLSADDGALSTSDTVTISVTPPNTAPSADAGPDATITLPNSAALDGTVTDDGISGPLVTTWSTMDPGVTFDDVNLVDATASFSAPGTYTLMLTADDGEFSDSDTVTITVEMSSNMPPVVDAGADATIEIPVTQVALDATVSDDGLPVAPGMVTTTWSSVDAGVSFDDINLVDATVTLPPIAGTYVLTLTADDGESSDSDTVTITVEESTGINIAYVAGAAPLPGGDRPIRDQMEIIGATVTAINDDDAMTTDYSGFDLIFVSTSVVLGKVGDHFATINKPVITTEQYLLGDMNMAENPTGVIASATIDIELPSHPIAASRTGAVTFTSTVTGLGFAQPGPGAAVIATADDNPVLFAYQTGDEMIGGILAPANRVAFPGSYRTANSANVNYRALLNAAIAFALDDGV